MPVPSELPHDPSAAPLPPSPSAGRRPAGPRPALLAPARPRRCPAKLTPQTGRINHVGLTVSSVPHAEAAVYSPLLTFLGFLNCRPYAGRRPGRPATSVWCNPRHRFGVVLYEAERGGAGSTRGAVGLQHLCLNAGSRSEVDEVARMCARLEMEVDGPKEVDISPGYYSCHVHDIDGIHLEVAYSPGLWESVETYPAGVESVFSTHLAPERPAASEEEDGEAAELPAAAPPPPPPAGDDGWSAPRPLTPGSAQKYNRLMDERAGRRPAHPSPGASAEETHVAGGARDSGRGGRPLGFDGFCQQRGASTLVG